MPKITAASVEQHREQVQRRVFDAFVSLMAEQSFDAITMAKLAAAAGIGRTAIYHHFPDKETVVVAFATQETSSYIDGLRALLAGVDDPVDRLTIYMRHQLDAGQKFHIGLGPQLYGALSQGALHAIRGHIVAIENVLRDILNAGVAQGIYTFEDESATISLIHACLAPRDLPGVAVERFVLRALGVTF
ncbi:TetR/AcrR family transcriptional regulator [Mycobacterium sp. TY814]|uniref:TetR/AcrR family transcriptional regulator n=1 Tax=unclassified Mycobacterium TaxID=2642494 RepID=UPI002740C520|nr:TetR/AcrR family transcriptional regulator [Mycobacterium sp. TY814]MDP7723772.1 TetR/AcrR family transcriptional regulator [Mycobacterium sp. TY814]